MMSITGYEVKIYQPMISAFISSAPIDDLIRESPDLARLIKAYNVDSLEKLRSIMNTSWYSIVRVSRIESILEELAHCFDYRRIFLIDGPAGSCAHVRSKGFRLFDQTLNHGYDQIEDNNLRKEKIIERILWLSQQEPIEIYRASENDLQHNHVLWNKTTH